MLYIIKKLKNTIGQLSPMSAAATLRHYHPGFSLTMDRICDNQLDECSLAALNVLLNGPVISTVSFAFLFLNYPYLIVLYFYFRSHSVGRTVGERSARSAGQTLCRPDLSGRAKLGRLPNSALFKYFL